MANLNLESGQWYTLVSADGTKTDYKFCNMVNPATSAYEVETCERVKTTIVLKMGERFVPQPTPCKQCSTK
ncbi:MAG: hypothetical protein LBI15_00115 [Dysgonamonadaceae bacterium]|jgi:hypothetical protein|nr:hypothetical protein [Dysgonamonadaceae bacterium]